MVHFVQKTKNIQQNITFSAYNFVSPTAPIDDKFVSHRYIVVNKYTTHYMQ